MTRQRWVQIDGQLIEVGNDYTPPNQQSGSHYIIGDKNYLGLTSPIDGRDISTKTKHNEYMKEKGLALVDDFSSTWKKAEQERITHHDPTRKNDLIAAYQKHNRR